MRRAAPAGAVVALTLAMYATGGALSAAAGTSVRTTGVLSWALALGYAGVGTLVAVRRPGNPLGPLFLGVAASAGLSDLAHGYADWWTAGHGGSRTLGQAAAVYGSLAWIPFILVPGTFLLLLFPDGRLTSRRWRPIAWIAAAGLAGAVVIGVITPDRVEDYPQLANPYAIHSGVLDPLTGLTYLALLVGLAGSAASLVVRFRRAGGDERAQIKWLALAGAVVAVVIPVGSVGSDLWGMALSNVAIMLAVLALPVATGIAILRHRLYDVDVVINRALVYGSLTATLAGVYVGTVLLLQLALSGLTQDSGLAVAVSTLAVAALFRPARGRIQRAVDRRFYRHKYDVQRTVERFAGRLRDEVGLDALTAELRGVVDETMQPAHVSLWLREAQR